MAWVYILKTKLKKYYIGSTKDFDKRIKHHVGGHTPSTKALKVEYCVLKQEYKTLKEARSVERKIKSLKRRDYVEKMIKEGYIAIVP